MQTIEQVQRFMADRQRKNDIDWRHRMGWGDEGATPLDTSGMSAFDQLRPKSTGVFRGDSRMGHWQERHGQLTDPSLERREFMNYSTAEKRDKIQEAFNQATPEYTTGADGNLVATKNIADVGLGGGDIMGKDLSHSWILPSGAMDFRLSQTTQPLTDAQRSVGSRFGGTVSGLRTEFPKDRFTQSAFKLPTDRYGNPLRGGITDYTTGKFSNPWTTARTGGGFRVNRGQQYGRFRGINPNMDTGKLGTYTSSGKALKAYQQRKADDQAFDDLVSKYTGTDGVTDWGNVNNEITEQGKPSKARKRFRSI